MNRSKFVAILTGAIAILLSVVYLLLVQLLDFRGEMVPAPVSDLSECSEVTLASGGNVDTPSGFMSWSHTL